jgi:protein phosphatase
VASRTAISTLIELALRTPDWIMRLNEDLAKVVLQRMSQRIRHVDAALIEKARADPSITRMGTTATVACSVGASLPIAHVGDSRAYLFRKGRPYRLTSDHTVAQALSDAGAIGPEAVDLHPMRHILNHVVGSGGGKAIAGLSILRLADVDQVLPAPIDRHGQRSGDHELAGERNACRPGPPHIG